MISKIEKWVVQLKRDEMPGEWDGVEYTDSQEVGQCKLTEWKQWRDQFDRPHIKIRLVKITTTVELIEEKKGESDE